MGRLLDFGKRRIVGFAASWVAYIVVLNILIGSATREGRPLSDGEKGALYALALASGLLFSLGVTARMKRRQRARRASRRGRALLARRPPPPPVRPGVNLKTPGGHGPPGWPSAYRPPRR